MMKTVVSACLYWCMLSSPVLAQMTTPFSDDLKTGQDFSFQQKDVYLSEYLDKEIIYQLDYTRWLPDESNGQIIIYNHGLQSHRAWFNATAEKLKKLGYTVYAFDRIGSGTSSNALGIQGYPMGLEDYVSFLKDIEVVERRGHIRNYHTFLTSIDKMVEIAIKEQPEHSIHLWANSYGAKIITRYLLDHERANKISSAVFTTPGLFRNKETMPLPFSKLSLIFGKNTDRFPSPVTPVNDDNGANWFTGIEPWLTKIANDPLSVRHMTRKMALQTREMDQYISNNIETNTAISNVPRMYLLVDDDPMMDNRKVLEHIGKNKTGTVVKHYSGGPDHKHFLTFTPDADKAISDIHQFISHSSLSSQSITKVTP